MNVSEKGLTGSLDVSGLSWLERLYCNKNKLTELPALPNSLTVLVCFSNELTELPALPNSLTKLDCSDNELTELPALPDNLTALECGYNQLTELPALPVGLTTLYCPSNNLTGLPALPNSLTYLVCRNNYLTGLPALPKRLTVLVCFDNELTELPALPNRLETLDCGANKLTGLSLNSNANYTQIDASHNYMADTSAVTGQTISWGNGSFIFDPQHAPDFVRVKTLTDGPTVAVVDIPLTLNAKVVPANATDQNILWSISGAYPNTTNASVENGVFTATETGKA